MWREVFGGSGSLLPTEAGVVEVVVKAPDVVRHRELQVHDAVFEAKTAGAVADVGASPAGAGVVRVVRAFVLVHELVGHPRLVGDPGLADERRGWAGANVHA